MNDTLKMIIGKFTSGRFIFTLITALVFAYLSITRVLPTDKVMEVILIVIYAYFQRTDRGKKDDTNVK